MNPHLPSADLDRTAAREPSADPQTVDATADSTRPKLLPPLAGAPTIPGYVITSEIAKGGMGRVYAAHHLTLDREVAIKTLLPGANADRFVTESKITARLPHPNIPPVYDLGTLADGTPFLAMKLIRGQTLSEQLKARTSPQHDLPRFVQIFEQIAQAVGFVHSRGIIHRDLKPLNVMVGEFGEVQVMDWGLAKEQASGGREPPGADPNQEAHAPHSPEPELTRAGAVLGTPGYMAPEQARGEPVDARADVFALGSTLAAILTGRPAFVGTDARDTVRKAANAALSDVLTRLDGCGADADLITLSKRCLSANVDDRPADGRAVADEVRAYRAGVEARLKQAETERAAAEVREGEQRKRRRVVQWAGGVVAAVLLAGTAVSVAFGVEANTQANEVRREKVKVEEKAGEITRQSGQIVTLNADLMARNEKYELALAQSFLGPVAVGNFYDPLSEYERNALEGLAASRDGPIGLICLREATSTPLKARQLSRRADLLHHAVVGLDSRRRAEVDDLFAARLKDPDLTPAAKLEVAITAAGRSPSCASEAGQLLLAALDVEKSRQGQLSKALAAVADDLPADRAAVARRTAADTLLTMKLKDGDELLALEREVELATLLRKMPAEQAAAFLSTELGKAVAQTSHPVMSDALVALAPELSPRVCEAAAATLLAQLGNKDIVVKTPLIDALAAVCRRLPADRAGEVLLAAMSRLEAYVHFYLPHIARQIARVSADWPADTAGGVCGRVADALAAACRNAYDHQTYYDLGVALLLLAERLPGEKAADIRNAGVMIFERPRLAPRVGHEWATLTVRLLEACRHLPTALAEPLCEKVADRVQLAMQATTDLSERVWLGGALSDAASGLSPKKGLQLLEKATAAMLAAVRSDTLTPQVKGQAAMLLVEAVGRMPSDKAAGVCEKATDALSPLLKSGKLPDYERVWVALRMAAMSRHLPADRAVALLLPLMGNTDQGWERPEVAQALAFAARRLPEDAAGEVSMTAADALLCESTSPATLDMRRQRSDALTAVALQYGNADRDRRRLLPAVAGGVTFATRLPTPRPLSPQQLVELLKHPYCVKEARRAVLDAVEFTYDRKFADLWEFVAFAQKEHPELDLLSTPKRLTR